MTEYKRTSCPRRLYQRLKSVYLNQISNNNSGTEVPFPSRTPKDKVVKRRQQGTPLGRIVLSESFDKCRDLGTFIKVFFELSTSTNEFVEVLYTGKTGHVFCLPRIPYRYRIVFEINFSWRLTSTREVEGYIKKRYS